MGAKNDLQQALLELDPDKVRQELLKRNCDWVTYKMKVPQGPFSEQIFTPRRDGAACEFWVKWMTYFLQMLQARQ